MKEKKLGRNKKSRDVGKETEEKELGREKDSE